MSRIALRSELIDGVLWLTKANPDAGYGISQALLHEMSEEIEATIGDSSIRAIVIDSESGDHNGAVLVTEIKADLADLTRDDVRYVVQQGHSFGRLVSGLEIPVIGVIRSSALGGGLELLLRCDFLFCLDTAQFTLPEVTLGLVAAWGGTQWAGRLMSFRKAQEFLLLGQSLDGRQAEAAGLVSRSFSSETSLETHIQAVLDRLRLCSPASLKWTKACLTAVWNRPLSDSEEVETEAEVEAMATGSFINAVAAFFEGKNFDFVKNQPHMPADH